MPRIFTRRRGSSVAERAYRGRTLFDEFEGEERLGQQSLQRIEPPGPTVEHDPFQEERVEKRRERRGPRHQAEAVPHPQKLAAPAQQICRLLPRVALLRRQPAHQRLTVVVVDDTAQPQDAARYGDTVCVPLLPMAGAFRSVKYGARRVEAAPQRPAMDAVNKPRGISADIVGRV